MRGADAYLIVQFSMQQNYSNLSIDGDCALRPLLTLFTSITLLVYCLGEYIDYV